MQSESGESTSKCPQKFRYNRHSAALGLRNDLKQRHQRSTEQGLPPCNHSFSHLVRARLAPHSCVYFCSLRLRERLNHMARSRAAPRKRGRFCGSGARGERAARAARGRRCRRGRGGLSKRPLGRVRIGAERRSAARAPSRTQ